MKAVRCSITGHLNLFQQSFKLHFCEETRQDVISSHKSCSNFSPLPSLFPTMLHMAALLIRNCPKKGNRVFVLIGTRCWVDKLSFFFLPRYEINHMTKRKGCKQATQARNRSFQGNTSFTDNFAKQPLAKTISFPRCFFIQDNLNGRTSLQDEKLTCNSYFCLRSL